MDDFNFGDEDLSSIQPGEFDPGIEYNSAGPLTGSDSAGWSSDFGGGGGGSSGGGGLAGMMGMNQNDFRSLMGLGSGIAGLWQGNQMQNLAKNAFSQGNPFGQYRSQYAQQLASLMQNPSSVTSLPGYQFQMQQGTDAIVKGMGSKGYNRSGNEMMALDKYGQGLASSTYEQQEQILSQLAGAGMAPNLAPGLQGYAQGSEINSSALASLAFGGTIAGGMGTPAAGGAYGGGGASPGGFSSAGGEAAGLIKDVGAGYGIYNNIAKMAGGAKLAGSDLVGDIGMGLGVYQGIEKGGVSGYGQAATDLARLGSKAGLFGDASSAVGSAAGYLAAPLAVYNFVDSWKSGATGHDALSGAEAGAAIGSIVPGIGTLIGGVIGGVVGAVSSAFGSKDKSKETWVGWANGGDTQDLSKVDPTGLMWAVGGLWRAGDPNFAGTKNFKDGNQFSTAMANQIASAIQSGKISATTDPDTVYSKVVQPWINGLPGGWNTNAKAGFGEQQLMRGLVTNYMKGKPITWGETQGGQPDYQYTSLASLTGKKATPPISGPGAVQNPMTPGAKPTPFNLSNAGSLLAGLQPHA